MEVFFQSAAVKKYAAETMPDMIRLENLVGEKGFFVGDQVTKIHSHSPNFGLTSMDPIVVKHLSFMSETLSCFVAFDD